MPRHQAGPPLDPAARARVLEQAREIATELTALCAQRADRAAPHSYTRVADSAITAAAALAEAWEMLAQAVALQALAQLARERFPSAIEGQIVDLIAGDLVAEINTGFG